MVWTRYDPWAHGLRGRERARGAARAADPAHEGEPGAPLQERAARTAQQVPPGERVVEGHGALEDRGSARRTRDGEAEGLAPPCRRRSPARRPRAPRTARGPGVVARAERRFSRLQQGARAPLLPRGLRAAELPGPVRGHRRRRLVEGLDLGDPRSLEEEVAVAQD